MPRRGMQRGTKATEFSRKSATRYRRNHHRNHHRFWQALDDPGKSFSCVQIATMLGDITLHHINPMLLICRNRGYHFEAHKLTGYRGTSNLGGVGVKFRHADYDYSRQLLASRRKRQNSAIQTILSQCPTGFNHIKSREDCTQSIGRVRQGGVISAVAVGHRQAALAVMCRG